MEPGFAASEADAFALIAGDASVIGGGDLNAVPAAGPDPLLGFLAGRPGVSEGGDGLAEARQELGRLLAGLRDAAGLSQRRLGPLAGYSAAAVAKAEKGRRSAGAGFWSRADEVLGAGGELVRGYEKVRELQQAARRERRPGHAPRAAGGPAGATGGPFTGPRQPPGGDAATGTAVSALVNCPYCGEPLAVVAQLRAAAPALRH